MKKQEICLGLMGGTGLSAVEQIYLMKKTGFDGFFFGWKKSMDLSILVEAAKDTDMRIQSVHAPFKDMATIWQEDSSKSQDAVEELCQCIEECSEAGINLIIMHSFIGFEDHTPNDIGLYRIGQIVSKAKEKNVKLAFENTEGEEYLKAILDNFGQSQTVGFCWDTGHQLCYNHGEDMMEKYGELLLATHLNDNLGISSPEGTITWLDDLHLLPFDGIADWDYIVKRLDDYSFSGPLTFELSVTSKPGRYENDVYRNMPFEEYLKEVYKRACLIATKRNTHKKELNI